MVLAVLAAEATVVVGFRWWSGRRGRGAPAAVGVSVHLLLAYLIGWEGGCVRVHACICMQSQKRFSEVVLVLVCICVQLWW